MGFDAEAIAIIRDYVTDWLGSALAGHATEPGKMLLDYAACRNRLVHVMSSGVNLCFGQKQPRWSTADYRTSSGMDDLDLAPALPTRLCCHPGGTLAVAEQIGASGYDLLSAVIVSYELVYRIGVAVGSRHYYYFHNTATCGVLGRQQQLAGCWGFRPNNWMGVGQCRAAWPLVSWQFNADGTIGKHHCTPGRAAARYGVLAATLAATGLHRRT